MVCPFGDPLQRALRFLNDGMKKQSIMQRNVYQIENTIIAFPVYLFLTNVS